MLQSSLFYQTYTLVFDLVGLDPLAAPDLVLRPHLARPAWTPVLVKISGEKVSLYSGYRLGLALAWRLGPVATWRLPKALGEMQECEEANEKNTGPLLTRSQFVSGLLKASAGAALAFSVLSVRPESAEASVCCMYACEFCYDHCGRRCRSCDCVKRCKEGYNCYRCNCRCKARYC